ncbi:MAG: universal stress protein [Chloroflexi bacterium]|nr:universal stress protein [Chloroflexota bacterium]MCI0898763.1 universal stress protein [Chloroflexota bacterium]MCI0899801.1 universal stress protein [Chloroflexota bacterium]
MYEKILVPLDGSKTAETVLPNVIRLARESKAKVVLFSVNAHGPASGRTGPSRRDKGVAVATLERPDVQIKVYLDSAANMLTGVGVEAKTVFATGDAAEEILAYAAENACDLIAMSTRGRPALQRGLMGSVTDAVVRASKVPVLAVGPKSVAGKDLEGCIHSVAVPLDGSKMAETVLPHVEKLARLLSLEVVLLRVVRMIPWAYGAHDRVPIDTTDIERSLELEAKEYLSTVQVRFAAKGLRCRSQVLHGVPWDEIAAFSGKANDMMVALSTHGRSGITRFVLGSVADKLIRSLETPVLVVRPSSSQAGPVRDVTDGPSNE